MTPGQKVRRILDRLSREKFIDRHEYRILAEKIANKVSGNPSRTSSQFVYGGHLIGLWRGQLKFNWSFGEHESLMRDARKEGRQFVEIDVRKAKMEVAAFRRSERDLAMVTQNRKLLNQLKQEIKHVENNQQCR